MCYLYATATYSSLVAKLPNFLKELFIDFLPGGDAYVNVDAHIGGWLLWISFLSLLLCGVILTLASYIKSRYETRKAERKWQKYFPRLMRHLAWEVQLIELEDQIDIRKK